MKRKIYNLIILDESGSMMSIKPQAISGLNETLQTIKDAQEKYEGQSHYVTLVSFNSNRVKAIYDCCPVHRIQELKNKDYQPDACTPLYDAMGISLVNLNSVVRDEDNVLVTIITDGYENASRKYSGKAISQLVEELKTKGWIFAYIGANHDVEKAATSIGIRNSLLFDADAEGAGVMFRKERECRTEYYRRISKNDNIGNMDYFTDSKKETTKDGSSEFEKKIETKKWWWFKK